MADGGLLTGIERYYTGRFRQHGATPLGVDWNDEASQRLRFEQLLLAVDGSAPFTINDFGCGYGALVSFLEERGYSFEYTGYDVSEAMLQHARRTYNACRFVNEFAALPPADFTVASGIFNVKLDTSREEWETHVVETIDAISAVSVRGFAFNMLTSYADTERMRRDLYYGEPAFYFDLCKRTHARDVALLHDYALWEFTIVVRKMRA